jgi:hypothetical protein
VEWLYYQKKGGKKMEIKINYVKEANIKQPKKVELKEGKTFYSREIVVKTTSGFDNIILNSYEKEILLIEPEENKTKKTSKQDKKI